MIDPTILNKNIASIFPPDNTHPTVTQTRNALARAGYATVRDLVAAGKKKLLQSKNFGPACLSELLKNLDKYSVSLTENGDQSVVVRRPLLLAIDGSAADLRAIADWLNEHGLHPRAAELLRHEAGRSQADATEEL